MIVEPGDDARAAERIVALITKYAVRFDPVDRITFYSGIVRGLAPIRAELLAQMRADYFPERVE
jgi:acetate kinase